jgi:hypothetical protein
MTKDRRQAFAALSIRVSTNSRPQYSYNPSGMRTYTVKQQRTHNYGVTWWKNWRQKKRKYK